MIRYRATFLVLTALSLGGCSSIDRLAEVGRAPALSAIKNPVSQPGYRPVSLPMPQKVHATYNSNSLWRTGTRTFFNDQRASRVGDILTVLVDISDKAEIDNTTSRSRNNNIDVGIDALGGYEEMFKRLIPKKTRDATDISKLFGFDNTTKTNGTGSVARSEKLVTKIAAVVVQSLPNGNLVIRGKQEVRVNFEVRELVIGGIVRPEDISADNVVPLSKIAEARVAYGGRGQITDMQQPPYGHQVLDIILPF